MCVSRLSEQFEPTAIHLGVDLGVRALHQLAGPLVADVLVGFGEGLGLVWDDFDFWATTIGGGGDELTRGGIPGT